MWRKLFKKKKKEVVAIEEVMNSINAYEKAVKIKSEYEVHKQMEYEIYLHNKLISIHKTINESANNGKFTVGVDIYLFDGCFEKTVDVVKHTITDRLSDLGFKTRITEIRDVYDTKVTIDISWNRGK